MKALNYESSSTGEGAGAVVEGVKVGSKEGGGEKSLGPFAPNPPPAPKGSSITLDGSGDRSGRDGWNSMGLAEFYKVMLYGDHGRKL